MFVMFEKPEQVLPFVNYLNKKKDKHQCFVETEKDNFLSFLMLGFVQKMIELQPLFSEKIHSVVY